VRVPARSIESAEVRIYPGMHILHLAVIVLAWLIALAWLFKLMEAARGLATIPNLQAAEYDVDPVGAPSVAVIVPARNEAANVAACLESLLKQDYAKLRIVAVDDRSTDSTGSIMDALAREYGDLLEVLRITALPSAWLGKTHAMAVAARTAIAAHGADSGAVRGYAGRPLRGAAYYDREDARRGDAAGLSAGDESVGDSPLACRRP
jgi:cellulose synthase/poly-beta-1,6-N-acetylglucosamine synthase-like glycosyltransferase